MQQNPLDCLRKTPIPAFQGISTVSHELDNTHLSQRSRSSRRARSGNSSRRRDNRRNKESSRRTRVSERRKAVSSRSARPSRRAPAAAEEDNGYYENEPRSSGGLSNEQTIWMISGGVVVLLLFIGFVCLSGDSSEKKRAKTLKTPQVSSLERMLKLVEKYPEKRSYRKELVRLLMRNRKYIEANSHVQKLVMQNDIQAYTLAVECAFALGRKSDAEGYLKKAEVFAPTRLEPIKKIFAAELRKVPGGEESQAKAFPGVREAVDNIMKGEQCYKQGIDNNDKFREGALLLRKGIGVMEKAQQEFSYNQWIERRIVFGNKYLMWSNKMYTGNKSTIEE